MHLVGFIINKFVLWNYKETQNGKYEEQYLYVNKF